MADYCRCWENVVGVLKKRELFSFSIGAAAGLAVLASLTTVTQTPAAVGPRVDVREFGAVTTDLDSSQAFMRAQETGDTIFIPRGRYRIDHAIEIKDGKTWISEGATLWTTADAAIIRIKGTHDWSILGDLTLAGRRIDRDSAGKNEIGIWITNSQHGYINNLTVRNFDGAGVFIDGSGGNGSIGSSLTINNLDAYKNNFGIRTIAGTGAEYVVINSFNAVGNVQAGEIGAGNIQISSGNIVRNLKGLSLVGGRNHGHGALMGMNINHNLHYNLLAENVTLGFTIVGNHFYGGQSNGYIILKDSCGITISGGIIDAPIINDNSLNCANAVLGNFIAGNHTTIGGANPEDVILADNYDARGPWDGSRPAIRPPLMEAPETLDKGSN